LYHTPQIATAIWIALDCQLPWGVTL